MLVQFNAIGGIPDAITHLAIPSNLITSNSFVAQWSEPPSDVVCGPVQYIVTVSTGGIVISNVTINGTEYTATGLCSSTSYKVNVSADNIAGNSIPTTIRIMTIPTGKLINRCITLYAYAKNIYVCMYNVTC